VTAGVRSRRCPRTYFRPDFRLSTRKRVNFWSGTRGSNPKKRHQVPGRCTKTPGIRASWRLLTTSPIALGQYSGRESKEGGSAESDVLREPFGASGGSA